MKPILIAIIASMLLRPAFADDEPVKVTVTPVVVERRPDIEVFQAGTRKLIMRGQTEIGSLTNSAKQIVRVAAREAVSVNYERRFGMVVMFNAWGEPSAEVDYAELADLLQTLESMLKPETNYTKLEALDWTYRATDRLSLRTWRDKDSVPLLISIGEGNSRQSVRVEQPEQFRKLVEQCKAKIERAR